MSRFSKAAQRSRAPEGWRVYAVGDIHGRIDLLDELLGRAASDLASGVKVRPVFIFLGDYIDRGPDSKDVIDRLIALEAICDVICLKGNHEAFLDEFFADPRLLAQWSKYGGLNTLMSYGLRPPVQPTPGQCAQMADALATAMPQSHREFLQKLRLSLTFGDYFFVHAGARPNVPLDQQREEDLLWIRDDFLLHEALFEKIIVHGHSPVLDPEVLVNRINIDTGAYATGRLTCLVLEGDDIRFL